MKFDEQLWLSRKTAISQMCDLGFTVTHMATVYEVTVLVMASVLRGLDLQTLTAKLRQAAKNDLLNGGSK